MSKACRLRVLPIFNLLVLLLLGGCALGSPRLEVALTDARSGEPVAQAQVVIGELTAATDEHGAARVDLEPGEYRVIIRAEGYPVEEQAFALSSQDRLYALDLALEPRTLVGQVLAEDDMTPLSGLDVVLGGERASTDSEGRFSIIARQITDLQVSSSSIVTTTVAADQLAAAVGEDGLFDGPIDVMALPRVLVGSILEPDGTPVVGAEVTAGDIRVVSDDRGSYTLRLAPLGAAIAVVSPAHRPTDAMPYTGQSEYSVTLEPYVADLSVAEEGSGAPLAGVSISDGQATVITTDEQGVARLRVAPGSQIAVAASGYLTATLVYEGQRELISLTLVPTMLQGVLSEAGSGAPVADALVQVFREGEGSPELLRTDGEGRYIIPDATGVTRLFVKAPGYDRLELTVDRLGRLDATLNPFTSYGIYIPFGLLSLPDRIYELLDFVQASPVLNTVVIDVKGDWAQIAWPSDLPIAQEIGAWVPGPMDIEQVLSAAHERDIYTIARVVTFKDRVLAQGRPEWAVHTQSGALYLDGENLPWGDPFRREVWDYNIGIALEAIAKGFDEVQFDYLRFPSEGRVSDRVYSVESTFESRVAAMEGFCAAAYAAIESTPAFVSADIFGLTVWVDASRDMGIGQRLDDIAAHMDYISPMLYPQTFNPATLQSLGISDVELYPYETLYYSIQKTLSRTNTRVRPWLQHYSGRYTYGLDELLRQRKGAEDGGSTGWLFWNAKGSYLDELFIDDPYSQMPVIPMPPVDEEEE